MKNSKIEWTDHTFNPWIGCTKVSAGCEHCYAERSSKRFNTVVWGPGKQRKLTSPSYWRQLAVWNSEARRSGKRARVFVASLADVFDPEVDEEWLASFLSCVFYMEHLDFLLLTKRPELFGQRIEWAADWHFDHGDRNICGKLYDWFREGIPPSNVWMGVSVEDQEQANIRIPVLLTIPAKVRFLSCEPLLGQVNIFYEDGVLERANSSGILDDMPFDRNNPFLLHWVICGGESGPGARPMNPDWARSLRDQCQDAGVPFFFKQWGEWGPQMAYPTKDAYRWPTQHKEPIGGIFSYRVGKTKAGRLLDDREWNEVPRFEDDLDYLKCIQTLR